MKRHRISDSTSLVGDVDGLSLIVEQDVTEILDANKAAYNEKQSLRGTQRHWIKVADLPNKVLYDLLRRFGPPKHNQEAWKRWFNDPENRYFRTWHGNV